MEEPTTGVPSTLTAIPFGVMLAKCMVDALLSITAKLPNIPFLALSKTALQPTFIWSNRPLEHHIVQSIQNLSFWLETLQAVGFVWRYYKS